MKTFGEEIDMDSKFTSLNRGNRVEITDGHRKGERGTVAEVRDVNGPHGYAVAFNVLVRMDTLPETAMPLTYDLVQVKRLPPKKPAARPAR